MRYAVVRAPGEVVMREGPIPDIGDDELLVKVMACGVCSATDRHYMKGELETNFPLTGANSYFGHELSGIVSRVGEQITEFKEGDRVSFLKGGFQQFAVAEESLTVKIPGGLDFSESLAEPLAVVLNTLDYINLEKEHDIAVLGTGFMGLLLIQGMAKLGARKIIGVDLSDRRLALANRFGATHTINALRDDMQMVLGGITDGQGVEVVIEAAGVAATLEMAPKLVKAEGKIIIHGFYPKPMTIDMLPWHSKGLTIINSHPATERKYKSLMEKGLDLIKKGEFDTKTLITHQFKLDEMDKVYELLKKPDEFIKIVILPNPGGVDG